MKTLVIYYSRTGMTKKLAENIAAELGADIEELIDKDKRKGALGYLKSGKEAMQKKLAVIEDLRYNPAEYDLVILGTPTWAYAMACALRTYLTDHKGEIKQAAFFATNTSDGGDKAIAQMEALSGLKARARLVLTSKEVLKNDYQNKLTEFISLVK